MQKGKKKYPSFLRQAVGQIHLWLGLVSGIVVVILGITGCLYTFQKEISDVVWKEKFFVQPQQKVLPLSTLLATAQKTLGENQPIESVVAYKQPDRSWEFMTYKMNDTAITYFGAVEYFRSAFVNPYTGAVTGIRDYKYDFFNIVKYIHWSLLLNTKYGQPIVGYSTLAFVILLITGLVLWYPRKWNKATKKQAFTINWKARYKRFNYDLHNVPGFYTLLIALVLALTGLVYSFQWFSGLVYYMGSGTTTYPYKEVVSDTTATKAPNALDVAYITAAAELTEAGRLIISPAEGKKSTISVYGYTGKETYYKADAMQFDQYTGKKLYRRNYNELNGGEKIIQANYDIHVGAIGGLPGKIIAFIVSLIAASLPITGFLIWWWKRKKPITKSAPLKVVAPANNA